MSLPGVSREEGKEEGSARNFPPLLLSLLPKRSVYERSCYAPKREILPPEYDPPRFCSMFGVTLSEQDGSIFVRRTIPDSVAEKAGFQPGDILLSVNGHQRKGLTEMVDLLGDLPFGEEAVFTIERRGSKQEIRVVAE